MRYKYAEIHPGGPGQPDAHYELIFTRDEAIAEQRKIARAAKGYEYESDQEALDDWIAVHWAVEVPQ